MKGTVQGSEDLLSFDGGYAPSDSFSSSQQWYQPQGYGFDLYPSQVKPSTTSHDLVAGLRCSKSFHSQDNHRVTLDWQPGNQFKDQTSFNSVRSVNPSQLWNNIDPFGSEGVHHHNQVTHQGSDYGKLRLPAEPLFKNEVTGDQSPSVTMDIVSQDDWIADTNNFLHSEDEQ